MKKRLQQRGWRENLTHSRKWWHRLRRAWRLILPADLIADREGVAAVIVAMLLFAVSISFAFLIDITGMLIRRQQMQTMADFGSVAGGRLLAELIAETANQNVGDAPIPPKDLQFPARYLTPAQREFLQTNPAIRREIEQVARDYVGFNTPKTLKPFNPVHDVQIIYPVKKNDCDEPARKVVDIRTDVRYTYPFIMEKIGKMIIGRDQLPLKVSGFYSVPLCP